MEIAVEKLVLVDPGRAPNPYIKAYVRILIGDFLVVHAKVIRRPDGRMLVGLPDRPLTAPCPDCRRSNSLASRYCRHCGELLPRDEVDPDDHEAARRYYKPLCHPVSLQARALLELEVLRAYCRATTDALTKSAPTITVGYNGQTIGKPVPA